MNIWLISEKKHILCPYHYKSHSQKTKCPDCKIKKSTKCDECNITAIVIILV